MGISKCKKCDSTVCTKCYSRHPENCVSDIIVEEIKFLLKGLDTLEMINKIEEHPDGWFIYHVHSRNIRPSLTFHNTYSEFTSIFKESKLLSKYFNEDGSCLKEKVTMLFIVANLHNITIYIDYVLKCQ